METLTLNGKEYVKASKAAKDLGYASDYVGQLCRSGSVDAHLVGRTWYVNPETLGVHKLEKKRNSRVKAREYARKSIEASRTLSVVDSANSYKNIAIRYKPDTDAVIPQVKRVHIVTEKFVAHQPTPEKDEASYEVLNKDKKIIMSGSIPVYDAEEETALTDTVTLSPRIVKTAKKHQVRALIPADEPETPIATLPSDNTLPVTTLLQDAPTFEEKLARAEVQVSPVIDTQEDGTGPVSAESDPEKSILRTVSLSILGVVALLGFAGLFFERQYVYSGGDVTETFSPTTDILLDFTMKYKDILSERY